MKKKLCATFLTLLALMVFATSVFAAEARWRNVTKITPIILASTNTYSSVINGSEGTTKIDCTLITKRIHPEHIPKFPVVLPPIMGKKAHFLVQPTLNPAQHTS